eukprot:scaffold122063_cov43-Attheya_sp.AAC.2
MQARGTHQTPHSSLARVAEVKTDRTILLWVLVGSISVNPHVDWDFTRSFCSHILPSLLSLGIHSLPLVVAIVVAVCAGIVAVAGAVVAGIVAVAGADVAGIVAVAGTVVAGIVAVAGAMCADAVAVACTFGFLHWSCFR